MNPDPRPNPIAQPALKGAGVVLIAVAVLQILAMAHHPSVTTGDVTSAIERFGAMASLAAWVHGVLIALLLSGAWGRWGSSVFGGACAVGRREVG